MNNIKEALDDIKASDHLKQNTLNYLNNYQKPKRKAYALAFAFTFILCLFTAYEFYLNPVMAIEIDGEANMTLALNRLNKVIKIDAKDDKAKLIIDKHHFKYQDYQTVIDKILTSDEVVDIALDEGELNIVVNGKNKNNCHLMQNELNHHKEKAFSHHHNHTSLIDQTTLEDYDISYGQLKAYKELLNYTDHYTIEDIKDLKPAEIRSLIKDHKHH